MHMLEENHIGQSLRSLIKTFLQKLRHGRDASLQKLR